MILRDGRIYTLDGRNSIVSSIALKGGKVLAAGRDVETARLQGPGTRVVDLAGRVVIPGLNDSHMHLINGGLQYNLEVRWDDVPSLVDALRILREQAQRTPPGQWVRVLGGWSEFQFAEQRMPTIAELNAVSPDVPVMVLHFYDTALLNKAAVQALGYGRDTPQPPGGEIVKDAQGEPTGVILAKPSMFAVYSTMRRAPQLGPQARLNSMRQFMRELNRLGITSVSDGGADNNLADYVLMKELAQGRHMTVRLACSMFSFSPGKEYADFESWIKQVKLSDDPFYKIYGMGEILTFSAFDSANFILPRPDLQPTAEKDFEKVIRLFVEKGWPFRFHATYDESISRLLGVLENVHRDAPLGKVRWILDHAETISKRNIDRVKALGGGIAVQDRLYFQGESFIRRYGEGAARRASPVMDMLKAGIPVGAGTDATRIASYNPWISLYWFVSGKTAGGTQLVGAANRLDRLEALRRYTVGSAWFSGEEKVKGTLEPGKFADLVVLSEDYFAVPEERIKKIESVLTVMNGQVVYAKGPFRPLAPPDLPYDPAWSPAAVARADEGSYLETALKSSNHGCGHVHGNGDFCGGVSHNHGWIQGDGGVWTLSCNCMVV
ncbi:amidohydrolase [Cupriavidus sp. DF5525]|uniref:amidohydrolase n=1 Tax=Cupriavidus sp. DF5525 TaxID=3160989 RepID=UPI0035A819B4